MAGFARLYDAMAPLYRSKTSTQGLNPISESPSRTTDSSRNFEYVASSGQKHPAPSGSHSGSSATRARLDESDDNENEAGKNASFSSFASRPSGARASLRLGGSIDDDGAALQRQGSPRPAGSSTGTRDTGRSATLSPRPALRVSTGGADESAAGRSLSHRTASDSKQAKPYDSTDNMRLGVRDDTSFSVNSDAGRSRITDRSSLSFNRRQAVTDNGDLGLSEQSSRFRSSFRDDNSSLPRRRNFDGRNSEDDSPPQKSSYRDEISYRRRKAAEETVHDSDIMVRRSSPRAALKPGSNDDLSVRGRKELEADSDSPPLRSTSRVEPLNRRKELTSTSGKDDIPLRRRKLIEDDSDSPPAVRDKFLTGLTGGKRDHSPPSRLSPRNELPLSRRNDTDEPSDSLSLSRRRDLKSKTSDADDLSLRRRKDTDLRSSSPPLRSTSREEPLDRRRNLTSKSEIDNDLPLRRRRMPLDGRSTSPPPRALREDPPDRTRALTDDRDDLSMRLKKSVYSGDSDPRASDDLRLNNLGVKSGRASSPPPKSSLGKDLSPSRSSALKDSTSSMLPFKTGHRDSLLSRSRGFGESSDSESPALDRDDNSLRRHGDLAVRDKSSSLSTSRKELQIEKERSPRDGSGNSISPRRSEVYNQVEEADSRPKSGYKPGLRKEGYQPSKTREPQSSFRGDKEQPKSGALKRPVSSPGQDPRDKKKPSGLHSSDSDSSSETMNKKREAVKSPVRPKLSGKGGRSLSPPSRIVSKSSLGEISPRRGKDLDSSQTRTGTSLKPLDDRRRDLEKRKGERDLSPRPANKDDSLSPRRSSPRDDKIKKKELHDFRSESKKASRDDFSLGDRRQPTGRDSSPQRATERKSLYSERLKSPDRLLADKDEKSFVKRGIREQETPAGRVPKDPIGFDFSRYETQKLHIVKLRRPLPANLSGTRYSVVEEAARHVNFVRTNKDDFKTPFLIWNDTFISTERLTQLKPFQRVNHFPSMSEICRKDLLARNMDKLAARCPNEYKFVPRTWCLPEQLAKFRQHVQEQKSEVKPSYICKPIDGASGRGIKIYKTAEEVPQSVESECVLQEYVSTPFLIENVKFDLRLYVLITSCDPLRIYLFNDGFLRMSSEPYVDPQKCKVDEDLPFIHLTNCSVNKQNRPKNEFESGRRRGAAVSGMKRPLMFLNSYLQQNKYDVALVWRNIVDLIVKTVFAAYPHIIRSYRQCRPVDSPGSGSVCFELLGFDVLLDAELKPWLMEVNRSPSFDYETSRDEEVKLQLLEETLMLLNVSPADWKTAKLVTEVQPESAKTVQKEVADLTALLARLKRQDRMKDADARVCQRFRRIFPIDDAVKQEKLVSLMLDAISALLEGGPMEALQRETKIFYASKTDEVAKKLAQLSSKTVQQLMAEGQAASSDSGSDGEDQSGERRSRPRRILANNLPAGKLSLKVATEKRRQKSKKQQNQQQQQPQLSESTSAIECEQLAQRTLKFLNELSIRFPGKSNRGAEQLLRQLQDNWRTRKADVSGYWRLSLDADKRRKVLDIARRNVHVALDKALHMTASDVTVAAEKLARLFDKLYNRLLWCHGQGLWETFGGSAGWEAILRQSREAPTDTEINCCRRVVQLCQDCLLVVYLYSDAAQQQQQQQQQQQHSAQQSPLVIS